MRTKIPAILLSAATMSSENWTAVSTLPVLLDALTDENPTPQHLQSSSPRHRNLASKLDATLF